MGRIDRNSEEFKKHEPPKEGEVKYIYDPVFGKVLSAYHRMNAESEGNYIRPTRPKKQKP